MSSCITLKEAKKKLTCAAYEFAPIMKELLEMWLQAADSYPKHLQLPSTATATDLVQAALQQAPWPMQHHEPRQVAWLQKHLPGISTTMLESVSRQLDLSTRRFNILQSLPSIPDCGQDSATMHAWRTANLLFNIMAWVFHQVAPVAVLCSVLASSSQFKSHLQHNSDHQQHRLQQGNILISRVGAGLNDLKEMLMHLADEHHVFNKNLEEQGEEMLKGSVWLSDTAQISQQCAGRACVIWLELLADLPPGHDGTAQFYYFVYVSVLRRGLLSKQTFTRAQQALCRVLAQPILLSNLQTIIPPDSLEHELQQLVCSLQVTAEQLEAAGMDAEQAKQLLSYTVSAIKPSSSDSTAGSCSGNKVGSGQAADTGIGGGDKDGDGDGGLDDMQALLQLMYGCTPKAHNLATA